MELTQKNSLSLWAGLCLAASHKEQEGLPKRQILRGAGAPNNATGAIGDYYLDLNTGVLYGAKTTNGWESSVDLTGRQKQRLFFKGNLYHTGLPGISKAVYSDWTYASGLNDNSNENAEIKVGYINAPVMTNTILSRGMIVVYMKYGEKIFSLPYTSQPNIRPNTIHFVPMPGKLLITHMSKMHTADTPTPARIQYRYFIIPGSVMPQNIINYNDYNAVCHHYGIPL